MQSYSGGRKAANNVQILGWLFVVCGVLTAIASIAVSAFAASIPAFSFAVGLPLLFPALVLVLLGSLAILLAHVARAVFDLASRGGT